MLATSRHCADSGQETDCTQSRHDLIRSHASKKKPPPQGGMAELPRPDGGAHDAAPTISRKRQAGDFGEKVGGSAAMGWRPGLQDDI